MQIFGGLLVFMGYVLFDTQMIIERANRGDYNYVKHALDLFVDFAAIFVRLLVIMVSHYSKAF
jgi:FtsH-binding integral membrane protein